MAHIQSSKKKGATGTADNEVKAGAGTTTFHDFLGKGYPGDSSLMMAGDSLSVGASSGGGRGPISTTSDLASERNVGNHFEGVPFYGLRGELSGPETGNRLSGTKRSNSDSFMGSTRDKFSSLRPDALESSHMQKLLRNAGGERRGRPHDQEMSFVMHQMRPLHASLISQPSATGRTDASASKWDRVIPVNVGPTLQYPPRASHVLPFGYQSSANRFGDANAGPSTISQAAADEGSRTGIKGSGILSSINASGGICDRSLSGVPLSGAKQKSGLHLTDLESSNPSRQGSSPVGSQMTIFYGGQAHVFDNVHPNKADVIMALAGSNGGSWSTNYAPKPAARPSTGENYSPKAENETKASNLALIRELHGRSSGKTGFIHGIGSGDQISITQGIHRGANITNEAKTAMQAAENDTDEKREV
ncbi:protein TIFY 8 isoform X1 [Lycium barbarum]|uniref:protein TIFY 8 isoform X1 n=1 Tax=Lycium barbarum TaxID=112863 RepID=UPI00293EC4E4|nr:protein TIFY 8 isoform X1 [Lycium barbarum]